MNKYKVDRQLFFNWYFNNTPKEQISAFLSTYLLGLVHKDASFSLTDLLASVDTIPTSLITEYSGKATTIKTNKVEFKK